VTFFWTTHLTDWLLIPNGSNRIARGEAANEELNMTILFEENGGYYILAGMYLPGSERAKIDVQAVMATFKQQ